MKAIKKIAAVVMAMVMTVSLVSPTLAIRNIYPDELSKLMQAPLYEEYKLDSTITQTLQPPSDLREQNFDIDNFWFNKPGSITSQRYYYMNVKEETAVEIILRNSELEDTVWAQVRSDIYAEDYYMITSSISPTKGILKPGIYYIMIGNYSETTPTDFTFSIKKTTFPEATSITFKKSKIKMVVGDVIKPETKNEPKQSVINATWSSSNEKVATVSQKGYITAKDFGSCTIKAKIKGKKTVKCTVEVNSKTVYMKNKSSKTLPKPVGAKNVKWSSSDKSVATVSSKGRLSVKGLGDVVIKAKVGKKTYRYYVMSYDFNKLAKEAKTYIQRRFPYHFKIKSVLCGFTPDRYKNKGCPVVFFKYTSDTTYSKTYTFFISAELSHLDGYSTQAVIHVTDTIIPYNISKSKIKSFLKNFKRGVTV